MTSLLLAREDPGRIGAGAHGTGVTVNGAAAVAGGGTALAEALDDAGVALALAGAGHVDLVALGEHVGLDHVTDFQLAGVGQTELFEVLDHAHAGLLQVACLGLAQLSLGHFAVTELDSVVAFLFLGHLLHDHAGAGLDDSDRNDLSGLVEDLRHADLLADDGFLHWESFLLLVIGCLAYGQSPEAGNLTRPHTQAADCGLFTFLVFSFQFAEPKTEVSAQSWRGTGRRERFAGDFSSE